MCCLGLSDELLGEFCPLAHAPYICDKFFSGSKDDFLTLLLMPNLSMMTGVSDGSSQDLTIVGKKKSEVHPDMIHVTATLDLGQGSCLEKGSFALTKSEMTLEVALSR